MAIYARNGRDLSHVIHHSDRGVQYLSIRYTERLGEAEIVASVGSKGDSYDNALAESFNGLYKTELIHRKGPYLAIPGVFATPVPIESVHPFRSFRTPRRGRRLTFV